MGVGGHCRLGLHSRNGCRAVPGHLGLTLPKAVSTLALRGIVARPAADPIGYEDHVADRVEQ